MRNALVTGGTRGIGAAIVAQLRKARYEVRAAGTALCDFSDVGQLRAFAERIARERVDVLVNNAGINKIGSLVAYPEDDFQRLQQVNVLAPFLLCRAVVPGMRRRRFGRIVNITSIFGVVSKAGRAAYSASKFGLVGLSRALALEVAADNVLVNCLGPGFVETDMTRRILGPKGMAEVRRQIPMGRLAKPEEIASAVKFLVSEENTYMTGQHILVDGGFTCA